VADPAAEPRSLAARAAVRTGLVLLGTITGLALLEFSLRTAGFVLEAASRLGEASGAGRRGVILCLGESTTAPTAHDWPRQLKGILDRDLGPGYRVVNKARPGITTGILLANLPDQLEELRPIAVVIMAGINDSQWFGITELERSRSGGLLGRLRGLRTFRALRHFAEEGPWARSSRGESSSAPAAAELGDLRLRAEAHIRSGRADEAEKLYRRIIRGDPGYTGQTGFRIVAAAPGDPDRGDVTRANLRGMRRLVREHGAALVVMQYPMRNVGSLGVLFESSADIIFVENKENFQEALGRLGRERLFTDRFGGDSGHCTAAGDRLIAENVARALRALLEDGRRPGGSG